MKYMRPLNEQMQNNIKSCINRLNISRASFYTVKNQYPYEIVRNMNKDTEPTTDGLIEAIFERYNKFIDNNRRPPQKLARVMKDIKEFYPEEMI